MTARDADVRDRDAIVALWQDCGLTRPWNDPATDFIRSIDDAASTILVIEADSTIAGSVMVGVDGHRGWVYYVGVTPAHRGAGHGRSLMNAAADWLRRRGAPKVQLMVRADNAAALGFYAALGLERQNVVTLGRFLDPE